jgi:L-threonylcarbamoyladenylate synthase
MIRAILPDAQLAERAVREGAEGMQSPGLLVKHYSPRAPLTLFEGSLPAVTARMSADASAAIARGQRVGILAADDDEFPAMAEDAVCVVRLGDEREPAVLAFNLYNALRTLDANGVDVILARTFEGESGLMTAIHDRLRRAAAGRILRVDT